jgi:hypothetical protein
MLRWARASWSNATFVRRANVRELIDANRSATALRVLPAIDIHLEAHVL